MNKVINLSAKTPTQVVTISLEIEVLDGSEINQFRLKVSSPELYPEVYDGYIREGFLNQESVGNCTSNQYLFPQWVNTSGWNNDQGYYESWLGKYFTTSEEVEEYVKWFVREFKSYYKLKREDFKLKQEWLSTWEFVEE